MRQNMNYCVGADTVVAGVGEVPRSTWNGGEHWKARNSRSMNNSWMRSMILMEKRKVK